MKKPEAKNAKTPTPEEVGAATGELDQLRAKVRELESERLGLQKESQEAREKMLRARADYDNLVKRASREAQDTLRYLKGGLLLRLAGLVETLEKVTGDLRAKLGDDARGLQLVLEDAHKMLRDEGLSEIPTKGQTFDYHLHQAVERVETTDHPESTILDVVQRGYRLGDEVLRPALVRVAVAPHVEGPHEPSDVKE